MSDFFKDRKDIFKFYKKLSKYPEFDTQAIKEAEEGEEVVWGDMIEGLTKYTAFMYDERSPLIKSQDLEAAKRMALDNAGIPREYWSDIINNPPDILLNMIYRFLKLRNNYSLTEYLSLRELLYNLARDVIEPVGDVPADKAGLAMTRKLSSGMNLKEVVERLKQLEDIIFHNDPEIAGRIIEKEEIISGASEDYAEKVNFFS